MISNITRYLSNWLPRTFSISFRLSSVEPKAFHPGLVPCTHTMTEQSVASFGTRQLAEYARSESLSSAPDAVRDDLERRVLDTFAAIVSGYRVEGIDAAADYAAETFAAGESTLLDGSTRRLDPSGATYANAMAANALDVDDGNRIAEGHPAAVLVPATLAAAEEAEATVGEFLDAMLAGYEISIRASVALHERTGMHNSSGSWGAVAAAAAVSRLYGYDVETTMDAMGIAEFNAPLSPVMRSVARPSSSMTKDGIGWGSHLGVAAAELAGRGFEASGTVFDEIEWNGLGSLDLPPLGTEYAVTESYYKPYPACRWIHSGIDAALALLEEHGIDPDEITQVRAYSHRKAIELKTPRPGTPDAAQYSYPYVLAITLLRGDWITPEQLNETWREDDRVHAMIDRISLHLDEEAQRRYPEQSVSRVEIRTASDTYRSGLTHPRGSRERPMTAEEHRKKQQLFIDAHVGSGTAEQLHTLLATDGKPVSALVSALEDE